MSILSTIGRGLKSLWRAAIKLNKKDCATFILILILSAVFLLMLTLNDSYEQDVSINLRLRNVPPGVVITTDPAPTFTAVLKDRGVTLLKYRQQIPTVNIDFENRGQTSGHVVIKTPDLLKLLKPRLEATTEIVQIKPDRQLEYFYAGKDDSKKLPVRLESTLSTDSFHIITDVSVEPDSVEVYATPEVYDTLRQVVTTPLTLSGINAHYTGEVPLAAIRGAKTSPANVNVTVQVDRITEKTVEVPVEGVNFPAGKHLKAFPAKVKVIFQVGIGQYRKVTADDFKLVVNYEELLQQTDGTIRLSLKYVPQGVSHVRLSPSRIEFLLEDVPLSEE